MKFFKVCLLFFIVAAFSACEIQGTVRDTLHGTPSKSDTVLPAKFIKYEKADSVRETKENVPPMLRR
ncbi:MAG: hypothetical protein ACTHK0_14425 [Ginsengibacter sp.]